GKTRKKSGNTGKKTARLNRRSPKKKAINCTGGGKKPFRQHAPSSIKADVIFQLLLFPSLKKEGSIWNFRRKPEKRNARRWLKQIWMFWSSAAGSQVQGSRCMLQQRV